MDEEKLIVLVQGHECFYHLQHKNYDNNFFFFLFSFFFYGTTARGGPWPPLQYVSKPLDPLLYLSIRLSHPSQIRRHVIQPSHDNNLVKHNFWKELAGELYAQDKKLSRTQYCRRMAG
jgi:hypothetical protein